MDAFNILIWPILSQVSYQGLDTENQRLQKALENSSKKIQQLEAELQEVETENQTLQRNLEELKISSKRLEQLEQEVGTKSQSDVLKSGECQLAKYKLNIVSCFRNIFAFRVHSVVETDTTSSGIAVGVSLTQLQ